MREMKHTGFMHNYMRMYWGKKILEWTADPEEAFDTTLAINNKYFLDGRDANSFAGVAWVFGKHDRAWFERPVFGKVRYMAASGLERKCDIKAYVLKVDKLARRRGVRLMTAARTLRLILGDQLNSQHSWFKKTDDTVLYALMEVRQETDYVLHHVQKILAVFAAMRAFADALRKKGHQVIYLHLDDPVNRQDVAANLRRLIATHGIQHIEYLWPDEYRLDTQLQELAATLPVAAAGCDSEHFLTGRDAVAQMFAGKKRYFMESFYRCMRKKHAILLEGAKPAGGKWNYDTSNRKRYDGQLPIPAPKIFKNDVGVILKMLAAMKVKHFGNATGNTLLWPVTRRQALAQLKHFLAHGLPHFGTYQDAMTIAGWSLFHSRLSFALNVKMLDPLEVIQAAVKRWQDDPERHHHRPGGGFRAPDPGLARIYARASTGP
jgi:deoxyribodipyrimidine photolyase